VRSKSEIRKISFDDVMLHVLLLSDLIIITMSYGVQYNVRTYKKYSVKNLITVRVVRNVNLRKYKYSNCRVVSTFQVISRLYNYDALLIENL
jgi:hypothetical protein